MPEVDIKYGPPVQPEPPGWLDWLRGKGPAPFKLPQINLPNPVAAVNNSINSMQDSINARIQGIEDASFRGLKWSGWNIAAASLVALGIWLLVEG